MMKRIRILIAMSIIITTIIMAVSIIIQEMNIFTRRIRMNAMLVRQVSLRIAFLTVLPNLIQVATSNALPIAILDAQSLNMAING